MNFLHTSKFKFAIAGASVALILFDLCAAVHAARLPGKNLSALPFADEIVVFESDACIYCLLFRRNVLPRYLRSPQVHHLPITFIDFHQSHERRKQLQKPLRVLPTVVVIRNGREAGRIAGYTDPDSFFALIRQMSRHAR